MIRRIWMLQGILPYPILQYIIDEELAVRNGDQPTKLPPMDELAQALGVSRGKLREDLIVAQAYGVVEMRPGDGTYVRPLDFYTAMRTLVLYSTACDWKNFDHFYKLRVQMELGFWNEATASLTEEDMQELQEVVERAERKLKGSPAEIPHREHRDLHLLMFHRLKNGFVQGLLRTYWDVYEAVGLHRYFDFSYYESMWANHGQMVEALAAGRPEEGREALARHFTLLENRLQGSAT
jgi:GntR family transcriptional repressor for pyruvate dehydrogenase complex